MTSSPLEQIYKSAEKFLTSLTLEETYYTIIKEALILSGAFAGSINLYKNGRWQRAYTNLPSLYKVITRKRGYTYKAFKLGRPLVVDTKEAVKIHPEFDPKKTGWRRSILIPLIYGKKKLGVLNLIQKRGPQPDKNKLSMLQIFGSLATLVIRKMQLNQEIKSALDARELFISMAAHELKTPLTTIHAYVQLLQKTPCKEINPRWIKQLGLATERLRKLVLELLQTEQIKKGELEFYRKKINLKQIVKQALTDFIFFNPKHRIVFNDKLGNQDGLVYADSDKLLQVFDNVLNNAAKFSLEGTKVVLTLEYDNPYYIIHIEDQGIGIDQRDLNKVFDKYFKGTQKHREGLGLGLYLSKDIIDKHHGQISILYSKKKQGTVVKIMLKALNHGRTTRFPTRANNTKS